jgi:hypothetical protein
MSYAEAAQALNGELITEPARVRFGDQPNQTMPHDWAEQFLRIVYTEHPGVFRSTLPRCAGLPAEEPKTTRRRP